MLFHIWCQTKEYGQDPYRIRTTTCMLYNWTDIWQSLLECPLWYLRWSCLHASSNRPRYHKMLSAYSLPPGDPKHLYHQVIQSWTMSYVWISLQTCWQQQALQRKSKHTWWQKCLLSMLGNLGRLADNNKPKSLYVKRYIKMSICEYVKPRAIPRWSSIHPWGVPAQPLPPCSDETMMVRMCFLFLCKRANCWYNCDMRTDVVNSNSFIATRWKWDNCYNSALEFDFFYCCLDSYSKTVDHYKLFLEGVNLK